MNLNRRPTLSAFFHLLMIRNVESHPSGGLKVSSILLVAGLYVVITNFRLIADVLLAFILILLLFLAANPIVLNLRRLKGGRRLATAIVVGMFLSILVLTTIMFYNPISRSMRGFIEQLPKHWERIQKPLLKIERRASITQEKIENQVNQEIAKTDGEPRALKQLPKQPSEGIIHSTFRPVLDFLTNAFKNIMVSAASMFFIAVTVFFGVVFMLLNPRPVVSGIFGLIPEQYHSRAVTIAQRIAKFVPQWAQATAMGMFVIGTMVFIAMIPIFGFQDALVLGIIATVLEGIPYIGAVISGIPALLLSMGEGGSTPLMVAGLYLLIQLTEHNLIAPVLVAGRLQMHPIPVVFSGFICVLLFGVLGVILAVPMAGIARIIHEEIYRKKYLPHVSDRDLDVMTSIALFAPHKPEREPLQKYHHRTKS